jgi:chromosome segregation ATPase
MTLDKIQAALAELQQTKENLARQQEDCQRQTEHCDAAIRALEVVLAEVNAGLAQPADSAAARQLQLSYVQLAIKVLEEIGHPTPINVLLDRIRERRQDPNITRGSVETSLLRYLTSKGENADLIKCRPGIYALRRHVESHTTAQHA